MWIVIGIAAACILVGWVICLQLTLNRMRAMQDLYDNTSAKIANARWEEFETLRRGYRYEMPKIENQIAGLQDGLKRLDEKVTNEYRTLTRLSQIVDGAASVREEGLTLAVKRIDRTIEALTARLGATPGEGEGADERAIEERLKHLDEQVCEIIGEMAAQWQQVGSLPAEVRTLKEQLYRIPNSFRDTLTEIRAEVNAGVTHQGQALRETLEAMRSSVALQLEAIDAEIEQLVDVANEHDEALRLVAQGIAPSRRERRIQRRTGG